MIRQYFTGCCLVLACCGTANVYAQGKKEFSRLLALQGLWRSEGKEDRFYEEWAIKDRETLSGRSFRIRGTDTVVSERITLGRKQGQVVYAATVLGQNEEKPVPFFLVDGGRNRFVFENPTHDYPRRIVYELTGQDSLLVWIDGGPKDPGKRMQFNMVKIN